MAYTPTVWDTGDTVTADKLNNMENGIKALNTLVVKVVDNAMNRTFKQISDAYKAGHPVLILEESTNDYTQISKVNTSYRIIECGFGIFSASSDSDYPELQDVLNSGVLIVNITDNQSMTLDKTWQEIYDAGFAIIHYPDPQDNKITHCWPVEAIYTVDQPGGSKKYCVDLISWFFVNDAYTGDQYTLSCTDPDEYPSD